GWTLVATETVTTTGPLGVFVTGLMLDETYSFRHSIETSAGVIGSHSVFSLTTRALDTPETFIESQGYAFADWSISNIWVHGPYDRHYPSIPGDIAGFYLGSLDAKRTYLISEDVSVAILRSYEGMHPDNHLVIDAAPETNPTFTFDSGDLDVPGMIDVTRDLQQRYVNIDFGTSTNTSLTVNLANDFEIRDGQPREQNVWFYAPITGGSTENPLSFKIVGTLDNQWIGRTVWLLNTDNSFRADLVCGDVLYPQANMRIKVGNNSIAFKNSMLGDPENTITLHEKGSLFVFASKSTSVLPRTIRGCGEVSSVWNAGNIWGITFTEGTVLDPCNSEGDSFGTLKISVGTLATDPQCKV
ncbi:MAG: hypothetical protein GX804_10590, partial [Lentisphaerae bacterium]|nr:hypothetical protein [Lentisphaerota bacterium]